LFWNNQAGSHDRLTTLHFSSVLETFCWPLPSHSFARFLPPFSSSRPSPTVRFAVLPSFSPFSTLDSIQANIIPVIAANHTVTIAAELVSMFMPLLWLFTSISARRRMERILSGSVRSLTPWHGPFHWKAKMNTCRRSALTQSHQL
jgi:hypothetical protein